MTTITDVAQLAGVSIKTVSRVINGELPMRADTKAKVDKAIAMLQYEPHRGARSMRSSKSGLIGIITGLFSSAEHGKTTSGLSDLHILRGAYKACREGGKTLLMSDMAGDPATVDELLSTFISHRVEGVIYVASFLQQVFVPIPKATPLVLVNCFAQSEIPAVLPDDVLGQTMAVEHLIQKGHRSIAYVGLSEEIVAGRLRRNAFIDTCARHGLHKEDCPVGIGSIVNDDDPFSPLSDVLRSLLQLPQRPSALCLGNDAMALHAYRLLETFGVSVPDEMAVVGFDDDAVICNVVRPRLSTVSLPYFEMGYAGINRLLAQINGDDPLGSVVQKVAGALVERESTPDKNGSSAQQSDRVTTSI